MEKPRISFSPPEPFSGRSIEEILDRISAIEQEIILIKKKIAEMEGKTFYVPPERRVSAPVPASEGPFLLESLDPGNMRVIDILLDWATFLLSKVGREGIEDVVRYYVDIKWVSPQVADLILKYSQGLNVEATQGYLLPEDHVKSLDYIGRIKEAMM